jgi:hypothetical protein
LKEAIADGVESFVIALHQMSGDEPLVVGDWVIYVSL